MALQLMWPVGNKTPVDGAQTRATGPKDELDHGIAADAAKPLPAAARPRGPSVEFWRRRRLPAMNLSCFRCGQPAFARLKVEAEIGTTRLEVIGEAAGAEICPVCMIGLARWLETGRQTAAFAAGAAINDET